MTVLITAESIVLVLLVVLVAGLLRSHADILRALHELGVGDPTSAEGPGAPSVAVPLSAGRRSDASAVPAALVGVTPSGETASVAVAGAGTDVLIAFLSSGCGTCAGFWQELGRGAHSQLQGTRVVVVTRDPSEESISAVARLAPADLTVLMSNDAWEDFRVPGSPYFVFVDGEAAAVTGEGTAARWDQLVSLYAQARADSATTPAAAGRGASGSGGWRRWLNDADREARADRELMAAGIHPGHPSLHPPARAGGDGPDGAGVTSR
ncbi:MAG TPA: hypothetical protein VFA11_09155 [Acidimicrobiales bacterium]|nr:hypothetical protein [Acidimicrobiales bacterium]